MSNLDNLKESLIYLSKQNPQLVKNLIKLQDNRAYERFDLCNTKKGELNLYLKKKNRPFYFHDVEGAVHEASEMCRSLEPNKELLFFFGTGLGYSFLFLKKWLANHPGNQLVFLEPHLGVLFHLFQTEIGKKMAEHPQVYFYTFEKRSDLNHLIDYLATYFSFLAPSFGSLPSYRFAYPHLTKYLKEQLISVQTLLTTRLIESKTSSSQAFINYLMKFPHLSGNYNASQFKELFKGVPCIICGAGPSLKKNLHVLKTLGQKALILAGSSAIPALTNGGLTPHLGNFFDPYIRVHERFMNNDAFEMPTFHCARTYYETSRWIHGPKLYTKGSDDTPFVDWIENELGFSGELVKEYISVTAYNTSIAILMGCDPIIYVGVDLAYTNNEAYMSGIEKEVAHSLEEPSQEKGFEFNKDLYSTDIFGEPILTRYAWQVESGFIGDIARPFIPSRSFINATEGGIGMTGIPNKPLQEIADQMLLHSYPIEEWIHSAITPFKIENNKIEKRCFSLFKEFKQSLKRVQKIYRSVLKEAKGLQKKNKEGILTELDETYLVEAEQAISREIAYQYYLTHHHQVIDIEHLKTHSAFHLISDEAPQALINEINLGRVINRYERYLQSSRIYQQFLDTALMKTKKDPWE